jgi:hypothetical protein
LAIENFWKLDLQTEALTLMVGSHPTREQGVCAMEMTAWLAGLPHTDRPRRTSEMIASYVRHLNDNSPDDVRQRLIPFVPRLIDTAAAEPLEQARSEFFAWKATRVFAPAALRAGRYSKRRARYAERLERLTDLWDARMTTERIFNTLHGGRCVDEWSPVVFAAHRAHVAARSAYWFAQNRYDPFGGASCITPYDSCPHAAAGAAFHAYRAGNKEIWGVALQVIGEVLSLNESSSVNVAIP